MSLTDHDILELNELCNAAVEGSTDDQQQAALANWLQTSDDARRFYVRSLALSASLCSYAGEMQTGEADGAHHAAGGKRWKWMLGFMAIAACLAVIVWLASFKSATAPKLALADDTEFVAQLSGAKDCLWRDPAFSAEPGKQIRKGQQLDIASGFAEVTFDCGAKIVLEGPASLHVDSAWKATLDRGTLKASLPPEAMGFKITSSTVDVVDNGTEFTMFSDAAGAATEVLVLKGEVSAWPRLPADQAVVLRQKDSRRFATSGMTHVADSEQKFVDLSKEVQIEHYAPPPGYAHWSFDEPRGNVFKALTSDLPQKPTDATVENVFPTSEHIHVRGHLGNALRFDGQHYARAEFPGVFENAPHTIVFWVKIPRDASLSSAYAMVARLVNSKVLGSHPIHIAWNRNAEEGTLGVLRTDYGRGFAVGETPLRDGRWHHIAVVFVPRDDSESPV